ncbi:MAG: YbhB/YbcL family Raf kinase inhibitor-like protein [Archaeoglobaceae archaeon]
MGDIKKIDVELDFDEFPVKYTCDGVDISPRVKLSGIEDVMSLAMIVDDPDAPIRTFTHWVIWNVSPTQEIPENVPQGDEISQPIKALQGKNNMGKNGYNGPCPPGETHRYYFKVYGLDTELDLPPGSDRGKLEDAMEDHVIKYGEAMAAYER